MELPAGPRMLTPPMGGMEIASHNMLKMEHGPVLAQPCHTVVYDHPSLTFTTGKVFEDILLDEVWTH